MKKIKDRIILGAVCGLISGAIGRATNKVAYEAKIIDININQLGSTLFLTKKEAKANTRDSKILASLVNNTIVGVTGVIISYLLSMTGRDNAVIKGAGMGALQWIGVYGFMSKLGLTFKSNKTRTHVASFISHALFGAYTGLLISKLGDDSLFPDKKVKKGEKMPLIATNQPSDNPYQTTEANHTIRVRRH